MTKKQSKLNEEIIDEKNIVKKEVELVRLGTDVVIFEGGYWMERKDYDFVNSIEAVSRYIQRPRKEDLGFDVNKRTRQIKYFFIPKN